MFRARGGGGGGGAFFRAAAGLRPGSSQPPGLLLQSLQTASERYHHDEVSDDQASVQFHAMTSVLCAGSAGWGQGKYLEKAVLEGNSIKGHAVGGFFNTSELHKCVVLVLLYTTGPSVGSWQHVGCHHLKAVPLEASAPCWHNLSFSSRPCKGCTTPV